jgi:predicted 2-oxoglutarate/Fe(II)-dependent dioxygenase YbiX
MLNIPTVTVAKETLDADTDTVTLTVASPASFTARHLLVRINAISDATADGQTVKMRFNGDSGNNYNQQQLKAVSTTETATRFNSRADIPLYDITDTADAFTGGEVLIPDAFSTRSHKASVGQFGKVEEGVYLIAGRWANTAAITSVTLFP